MKERYWHTTHDVKESMLKDAPVVDLILNFLPPEEMGFDPEKLKAFQGTIVCTPGMVHFLRPTEHGSELRTRFWFEDPNVPFDEMAARALLAHNVKEYTHLAAPPISDRFRELTNSKSSCWFRHTPAVELCSLR